MPDDHSGHTEWEVRRTSLRQPFELPVPRHACRLLLVMPSTQRLPVLDRRRAASAMRVDVIGLQVIGGPTPAIQEGVMFTLVPGALKDGPLICPCESAPWIATGPPVKGSSTRPDDRAHGHHHEQRNQEGPV